MIKKALLLPAVLLSACIFPSFEKFEENADGKDGGSAPSPSEDAKPDSTSPGGGGSEDASTDANPFAGSMACGERTCIVGFQYCCVGILPDEIFGCFGSDRTSECAKGGQHRMFCDGNEDCAAGEVCCGHNFEVEAKCSKTCDGNTGKFVLCTGTGKCETGTCTAIGGGQKACR